MSVADQLATGHDRSLEGVKGQHAALLLSAWWDAYLVALPVVMVEMDDGSGGASDQAAHFANQSVARFRTLIKEHLGR